MPVRDPRSSSTPRGGSSPDGEAGLRVEAVDSAAYPDEDGLYESGALLPGPRATLAGPTFDEWLDETYPRDRQTDAGARGRDALNA